LSTFLLSEDIAELKEDGYTNEQIEYLVESGRVAEVKWKVSHPQLLYYCSCFLLQYS